MTESEKIDEILYWVRPPEILVSCSEAARLLRVTPQTISAMIRQHRLHKTTIGASTGIRLSEIRSIKNPQ